MAAADDPRTPATGGAVAAHAPARPSGGRDRKKRLTRARLHRAAVELALEHGTDRVTVEEVAARAEVSPRTFFNYFATKEDAFVGTDPDLPLRLVSAVAARPAHESPGQAVRAAVTEHLATVLADEELWRRRRELAGREPSLALRLAGTSDAVERALVEAAHLRAGTDRATDLGPALAAHLAMAAVRAAVGQHVAAGFSGSLLDRLEQALRMVDGDRA